MIAMFIISNLQLCCCLCRFGSDLYNYAKLYPCLFVNTYDTCSWCMSWLLLIMDAIKFTKNQLHYNIIILWLRETSKAPTGRLYRITY